VLPVVLLTLAACEDIELEGRPCDGDDDCIVEQGYSCVDLQCTFFGEEDGNDAGPGVTVDAGPGFQNCDPAFFPIGRCESDIEGTWSVRSRCVGASTTLPALVGATDGCPGATATAVGTDVTGTITFDGNGEFDSTVFGDVYFEVNMPSICTAGLDCGTFALSLTDKTCLADGNGGCNCSGYSAEYDLLDFGGYTEDGGGLVTLYDGRRLSVCRSADTLLIAETTGGGIGPSLLTSR
jgi:hypothetical protein